MRWLLVILLSVGCMRPAPTAKKQWATAAVEACEKLRHHGKLDDAQGCFVKLARSSDPYQRAEGYWGIGQYQDSVDEFRPLVQANPGDPYIKTRWGRLWLERWRPADAAQLFQEALEADENYAPALVGMAMVASGGFEKKAVEFAEKALKADPKMLEAQELLAKLAVEDVDFDKAKKEAEKAIELSNESLDGYAVLAALEVLADRQPNTWLDKMNAVNPVYAEGYSYIAKTLTHNRRYLEAIDYYKKAIDKDPRFLRAHSELGITYMRLAREPEAREHLELAHNNGYRDSATTNSLNLMDSYKNFDTFKSQGMEVRLAKKEAAMLKLYVEPELRKAISTFEKKYKVKLDEPVKLEMYPNHEDFAVRTLGMPGLGALGVTFGTVVAMDSPSGRPPGSFHWASTLWHELSHVFVLTATKHRVPRWFTEGLAVHEETAVSPDWGDRLDPSVLKVVKDKKLLPVAELDRGFIRPSYPNQVIVSYFQAGRICDYINGRWGWQKLLDMMHEYSNNTPTPAVIEKHLGMKPEQFDKEFLAWLDKQLATPLAKMDEWGKRTKAMGAAMKEKRYDEVILNGTEIRDWFPEYVELGNVYEMLAAAYEEKGDKKAAMAQLEAWAKIGGRLPATLEKLAEMQEQDGRPKDALKTLEKINYVYPQVDPSTHVKLGRLHMEHGKPEDAIRELQASLAGKTQDPVTSHYELARAYLKANNAEKAYDHVLEALETAPGYRPAQQLLLELNSRTKKEAR